MKNLSIMNRQQGPGWHRGDIIAAWTYTHDDWKRYLRWKQQRRRKYVFTQLMMLATLGSLIGCMEISRACGYHAVKKKTVFITATGVVMRKRFIPFNTHSCELRSIHIIECMPAYILAIMSQSVISKQKPTTILIPVPRGRLGEAVKLMMQLERDCATRNA